MNYKEEFIKGNTFSESITKAYQVVFKKIKPLEDSLGKDVKDFNKIEMNKLLKTLSSKSYHSMNVKWSLVKKYMIAYDNKICLDITQDDLKKHIKNVENTSRYISRNTLYNRIKNLANPQDKAMLLLLFEGLFGHEYDEIRKLKLEQINTDTKEISVEGRVLKISDFTNEVIKESISKSEYYKNFSVGINDSTTNESYTLNTRSKYFIRTKPSKRTNNGLDLLGMEGFKSKIKKILEEIGLDSVSAITLYHSGLIEKILQKEQEIGRNLSISETKAEMTNLGAKKIQPAGLRKAVDLYKKNYKK